MLQYTCILPLSVLSICTTGTLGQKWDIPIIIIIPYTCMLPMSLSSICSIGTLRNGRYLCTDVHACYHCLSRPFVPLGHLDGNGMYLCTDVHACYHSIPSIRTTGTLGQKWDVPMYHYTCMLPLSVPSIRTIGTLVPMYQYTRMLPLSRPFVPLRCTKAWEQTFVQSGRFRS